METNNKEQKYKDCYSYIELFEKLERIKNGKEEGLNVSKAMYTLLKEIEDIKKRMYTRIG